MAATAINRKARRGNKALRRGKRIATTAVAVGSLTLGLAGMPSAQAATGYDVNIDVNPVYTTGTLAGLINGLLSAGIGIPPYVNPGPPANFSFPINYSVTQTIPLVGDVLVNVLNATLYPVPAPNDSHGIYNAVNGLSNWYTVAGNLVTAGNTDNRYRPAAALGIGDGAVSLIEAYRQQIQSVTTGVTDQGYSPFVVGPGSPGKNINFTNEVLLLASNPYRPNGGLFTRFQWLSDLLGIDTSIPAAGKYTNPNQAPASTPGMTLNASTVDLAWEYDPLADFPTVFNPFSIVNSLMAALPVNLIGGIAGVQGSDIGDVGLNLLVQLNQLSSISIAGNSIPGNYVTGGAFYETIVPNQLPIMELLRLPAQIINLIAGKQILGTPIADALEPAMKILVNVGYSDVLTPDELGQCAQSCSDPANAKTWSQLGYQAYDRQFTAGSVATPTPFGTETLTWDEWKQVPADVLGALVRGFQDMFNPTTTATPAATSAAAKAPSVAARQAAPSASAVAEAPQADTTVESAPAATPMRTPSAPARDARRPARQVASTDSADGAPAQHQGLHSSAKSAAAAPRAARAAR